jgi:hypothetical protein
MFKSNPIMTPKNTLLSATLFFLIVAVCFAVPTGQAVSGEKPVEIQRCAVSPDSGRTQRLKTPDEVPRGLNPNDWKSIRQSYEAGRRNIFQPAPGAWTARNPGQQLTAEFDGRAVRIKTDAGTRLGLKLEGYGFSTNTVAVGSKARRVTTGENRVEYVWDDRMTEWFVNDERGFEQGWTLASAPDGTTSARIEVGVTGGFRVNTADATTVNLTNGATALTYGGLKAWDATGRTLPARFEAVAGNRIGVTVETVGAVYPVTVDPWVQQAYLKASNTDSNDGFAVSVAVSGDTVVVGAPVEDSNATGVDGNQADNSAPQSGAAYVFIRSGGTWSQQAYLKASNTDPADQFGSSVAVSGDTVVVGAFTESSAATGVNGNQTDNSASRSGAAYVFVRNGTTWSQQAYLKASNTDVDDFFGRSVAVSGDTVVVGANLEASAATGVNGNQADNSASQAGAAYVFVRNGTAWSQQAYLKASNTDVGDLFGFSVAVSGDTVAVAAPGESSAATGVNGNQTDNSAPDSGAAYVFVRNGTTWSQQAYLKASNTDGGDGFGQSLSVSGDTVVVGAVGEDSAATGINGNQADNSATLAGAAYVFARNGTTWSQQAYLKASNTDVGDQFGFSVSVSGDTVVVGSNKESSAATGVNGNQADNSAIEAGAAYVFTRTGATWSQQAYLKASNTDGRDQFGISVAVSGDTVVVGANREDSAATGVNGNQADNSASNSGAAYMFVLPAVGSSPVNVNDRVTFTPTTQSVTGIAGSCAGLGYTNQYNLNVDLRNIGANTLSSPFFSVAELQEAGGPVPANPFRLTTADDFNSAACTGGLVGTTQAIPGPIAPNQVIPVNFQIAMPQLRRFRFFVNVFAVIDSGSARNRGMVKMGRLAVEATGFDKAGNPILTATFIPEKGRPALAVSRAVAAR